MGQLVRRVRCVGRIALVVLQCRQRADQIVAGVENRQPGTNGAVRILARLQQLMQRQPSGDAFIAAFDKIQSAVREQFYRASAGFLPSVPQIGRRETQSMCSPAVSQASICAAASEMMSPGR
mgnify:CR=1 FL=1